MLGVNFIKADMISKNKKFGIVVSRFNEFISEKLLHGAIDTLLKHGVKDEDVSVVWVPGSFEVPVITKKMAMSEKFDAIICLGTIIRGETSHFDFVANEAVKGIAKVSIDYTIPCVFGILTTDNLEQAIDRAGSKGGNKGRDAALVAIEMCNLFLKV